MEVKHLRAGTMKVEIHASQKLAGEAAARCAARTETWEYPRKDSGRGRALCAASLSAAFHAASSSPSANQLSDASRCWDQNFRGTANVCDTVGIAMDFLEIVDYEG